MTFKKNLKRAVLYVIIFTGFIQSAVSQEIGANFNHNPNLIGLNYLKKTGVEWIRTTPYAFDYISGRKTAANDPGLGKIIDANKAGYKVAFGLRWDFKKNNLFIPQPGSAREKKYFAMVNSILRRVGGNIDIFKLGNEPNLETKPKDMQVNQDQYIPLVKFTERLLNVVILPFYKSKPGLKKPDIYVGSLPALFEVKEQKTPGVIGLIRMAQNNKNIKGLSVHLHVTDSLQMGQALEFARSIMPAKDIIIPEFSMFKLYKNHMSDYLGDSEAGKRFAVKYGYKPKMKLYEWYSNANTNRIAAEEWQAMFNTRSWFYPHTLQTFYHYFQRYHVILATYGLFIPQAPKKMTPESPSWFINPIFACKTLIPEKDGSCAKNPLWYNDFISIVNQGKNKGK